MFLHAIQRSQPAVEAQQHAVGVQTCLYRHNVHAASQHCLHIVPPTFHGTMASSSIVSSSLSTPASKATLTGSTLCSSKAVAAAIWKDPP